MNSRAMVRCAAAIAVFGALLAAKDSRPTATDIVDRAKAQAATNQRAILVIFHASWCGWCKQLDRYIESPENQQIFDKYFVTAHVTVEEGSEKMRLNTPGGDELFNLLGGRSGHPAGLPFFAFLDSRGFTIVNSVRPGRDGKLGVNIGFPDEPSEIEWFMSMLSKAAPRMTPDEAATLERWLPTPTN